MQQILGFISTIGPVAGPILGHLAESLGIIAAILATKWVIGTGEAIAAMVGLRHEVAAATAATDVHIAAAEGDAAAMEAESVAAKGLSLSMKGMVIGAALLIPILQDLSNGVNDWVTNLEIGSKRADEFRKGLGAMGLEGSELQLAMGALNKIAKDQNRDISNVIEEFQHYVDGGMSVTDVLDGMLKGTIENADAGDALVESYRQQAEMARHATTDSAGLNQAYAGLAGTIRENLDKALNDTGAMLTQAGSVWAAKLRSGETVYATSAQELADKLPAAEQAALDAAKAIAKKTPYEIAKSFRDGEDAVYQAALALGEQQTHAQDIVNEIVQKQDALASKDLAKQLTTPTKPRWRPPRNRPTSSSARSSPYRPSSTRRPPSPRRRWPMPSRARIPRPGAGLRRWPPRSRTRSTRPTPRSRSSPTRWGWRCRTPCRPGATETKQSAEAQAQAALDGFAEHQREMHGAGFTAGENFTEGVRAPANLTDSRDAGGVLLHNAQLGVGGSLWTQGYGVGRTYGDGLISSSSYVNDKAEQLKLGLTRILQYSGSPPYTHAADIGWNVGAAYIAGIGRAMGGFQRPDLGLAAGGLGAHLDSLTGSLGAPLAPGAAPGSLAAGGAREVHYHYELTYQGRPKDVFTRADYVRDMQGLSLYSERSLSGR